MNPHRVSIFVLTVTLAVVTLAALAVQDSREVHAVSNKTLVHGVMPVTSTTTPVTPTNTPTATETSVNTPTSTATSTATDVPNTPTSTATSTATSTTVPNTPTSTVTSAPTRTPFPLTATPTATPTPVMEVSKGVGTIADQCSTSQELTVKSGDDVYFCFTIKNTSPVTLTEQTLIDANLGLTATLHYDIPPNGELQVNNALLVDSGYAELLGPIEVTGQFTNTVVIRTPYQETTSETRAKAVVRLSPTSLEEMEQTPLDLYLPLINQ